MTKGDRMQYFVGVDVGTGSARAGVFDAQGHLFGSAKRDLDMYRSDAGHFEQSSAQVWQAVCDCVRAAVAEAAVDPDLIAGIGFDATCSLVVQGAVSGVGDPRHPERDIIVWSDHRARAQAERINAGGHAVLDYVGGRISPEMQTPKLLWLRENLPEVYVSAAHFFDLTDFLTWKASGATDRSICTVTCKWTYLAHENRWDASYFQSIGLGDLADQGFARIGTEVVPAGTSLGTGLTPEAALEMGLRPGVAVAAGLIDAHAGGVGTVGASGTPNAAQDTMAYVFGTSSCTMTSSATACFVPGVWGPYQSAMVPGLWLNEGGQSAAGAALDQLTASHPASAEAAQRAAERGMGLTHWLADEALSKVAHPGDAVSLARGLHVVPEYLGNRAPFADPGRRAVVAGLGVQRGVDSLVALYVAGLCGLAYGLRQILDAQSAQGLEVSALSVSGGAGTHPLSCQVLADATGLPVDVTESAEPVLLGSAMLAAVAAGRYGALADAMPQMSRVARRALPDAARVRIHQGRYDAFARLQATAADLTPQS
ncbi:FGGY-family carbohydrate kinase [Epibacterium sp. MM17-32]|uniref:FGGY-family carbohydrate kinase n=1 Tax=Epibacterium sp. MM17-32 TaxID=2917734 RepID=UPI001EF5BEE6|nr:FGGY-family carbohydrate kinase [Epibacterium sp. MM17-32]MCG7630030.1 FGGY-family carbohydrate kinase [Epibacterium sp. MM17-32]